MRFLTRMRLRGASILLLSFIFMSVLFLMAQTLFQVIPAEFHASHRSHTDLMGHYVARSGVQDTMSWLQVQMEVFAKDQRQENLPDYNDGSGYPHIEAFLAEANDRRPFSEGDWSYQLELQPLQDQNSLQNILEARTFSVRSTAFLRGRPIKTIDVMLRQKTFAMFGFLDSQSQGETPILLTGQPQFFGPVHTNGFFNFNATSMDWDTAKPSFADVATHSKMSSSAPAYGDGNVWTGDAPYDTDGPISGRYEAVFNDGRNGLRLKNNIELPTNTDGLLDQAYPGGAPPTDQGVYVAASESGFVKGGVYVAGDVGKVNMRLDKFGNQKIEINQIRDNGTKSQTTIKKTNCVTKKYSPPKYGTKNVNPCITWSEPTGDGGGVSGPPAAPTCLEWTKETYEQTYTECTETPVTEEVDNVDPFETHIYEVTESPVTVTGPGGQTFTAQVGQTLVLDRHQERQQSGSPWVVDSVKVLDGQINGTIYVNGNVGRKDQNSDYTNNGARQEGLWGIVKGSAKTDEAGNFVTDTHGERTYNNKIIVPPLDKEIAIGGDLLQFDPTKFKAKPGNMNLESVSNNKFNWTNVARDPRAEGPDALSPNNQHVFGIISKDVWLNGPKQDGNQNVWTGSSTRRQMLGNDGINDIYAVILAGKSEVNGDGSPKLDANGDPIVSGGFGTWHNRRDQLVKGLGKYQLFGGVIQGTTGKNFGGGSKETHHWLDGTGTAGYDVSIRYDLEAPRQPTFPNLAEFRMVRYFERSARN